MNNPNGSPWFTIGTVHCGILMGATGVVLAFLLIFLGFWKTLLVTALFALGFWIGSRTQKTDTIKSTINKMFPPKGE